MCEFKGTIQAELRAEMCISVLSRETESSFFPLETPSAPPQPLHRRLEAAGEEGAGNEVLG